MKTWRLMLVVGLIAAGIVPAVAQAPPAQAPQPAQPAPAPQPAQPVQPSQVTLRYKFLPGDVMAYRFYLTGQGNVGISGLPAEAQAPGGQLSVPLQATITVAVRMRVLGVKPDGVATLRNVVDAVTLSGNASFQGQAGSVEMSMDAKGQHIKMNGKPVPQPPDAARQWKKMNFFGKPFVTKMDARGRLVAIQPPNLEMFKKAMPGFDFSTFYKSGMGNQFSLPEKPVSVGESWQDTVKMPLPGVPTPLAMERTSRLMGLEKDAAGHTLAKIQQTFNVNADNLTINVPVPGPSGQTTSFSLSFDRLREAISGPLLWSVDEGKPVRMDMDVSFDMGISAAIPLPGPQGQVQPQQMQAFAAFQGKAAMARK